MRVWRGQRSLAFQSGQLQVDGAASFVVLAPHCDDETLAAGGLVSVLAEQGVPVHIVLMTNGDGFNPYALGTRYGRLQPTPQQYIEFAYLRQAETLEAVRHLGLTAENVSFLGYPDRGLAALWDQYWDPSRLFRSRFTRVDRSPYHNSRTPGAPFCGRAVVDDLKALFRAHRPTHIITAHPHDSHSDHWATYCFALWALEELRLEGEAFANETHVLAYLIHRGLWPRPRGYRPLLPLHPPRQYYALPYRWITVDLPPDAVFRKRRALQAHASQLRYMRSYLLSFVRRNELFGLFPALVVPEAQSGDVWSGPYCEVFDPVPANWPGRVRRGGDVRSVQLARYGGFLYVRMNVRSRVSRELSYCITFYGVNRPGDPAYPQRNRLRVQVRPPNDVLVTADGDWQDGPARVLCQAGRHYVEVAIPVERLRFPERLFMGVETRFGRFIVDQVAWQMLVLSAATPSLRHPLTAASLPSAVLPEPGASRTGLADAL